MKFETPRQIACYIFVGIIFIWVISLLNNQDPKCDPKCETEIRTERSIQQ